MTAGHWAGAGGAGSQVGNQAQAIPPGRGMYAFRILGPDSKSDFFGLASCPG